MSRPSTRPIIVSVEVTGFEPVQARIAADGQQGQKEAMKMISSFLLMANGINTDEPGKDLVIKVSDAPFLDLTTEISDLDLPGHVLTTIGNIRSNTGRDIVHSVWQLAMLTSEWLKKTGNSDFAIRALNLLLADYDLCVGMSREDLPPGEDKPWNKEPYFEMPGSSSEMAVKPEPAKSREVLISVHEPPLADLVRQITDAKGADPRVK